MQKVRWGIVGAGNIASTFAGDIAHAPHAQLLAVAARDGADAEAFARQHGVERAYGGYDALFADPDVDAVYVATPHTRHLPNSLAALAAGKHVLCEKPLTTSVDECRELLSAADRSGCYLMEALWTWFLPAIAQARAWHAAGRLGELRHISADFGFRATYDPHDRLFDRALGGGCLLDIGIYPIALARLFADTQPTAVQANARFAPSGVEDDVVMSFDYGDLVAELVASFRCVLPNVAHVVGTVARIEIPGFWAARQCRLLVGDKVIDSFVDHRRGSGFEYQIEAVSRDILAGRRQSAIVPHAVSLALQEDMARVAAACAPGDSVPPAGPGRTR